MIKNCQVCGKEFYVKPSWEKRGRGKYCSRECYFKSDAYNIQRIKTLTFGERLHKVCKQCGKKFIVLKCMMVNKNDGTNCSKECRRKNLPKGKHSHAWKGGKTSKNNIIRQSIKMKEWREKVFKRDDYICQKCKIKGVYLHAHHIKSFSGYPAKRFIIKNGLTLCKECHYEEHRGARDGRAIGRAMSKTISSQKKKLDRIFSEYIRRRDSNDNGWGRCITCKKTVDWKYEADAGHFQPRQRLATRWDERNVHLQGKRCNNKNWSQGEQYRHGKEIDLLYGEGTADSLERKSREPWKKSVREYDEIIDFWKEKLEGVK